MINAILSGILKFLSGLITIVFKPLDQFIDANIPSLSSVLNSIGATFQFISHGLGWVIDCLKIFFLYIKKFHSIYLPLYDY